MHHPAATTPEVIALVERLRRAMSGGGDPEDNTAAVAEVDALFAAHQDRIYAICRRFVGNEELAREMAQETLLTAYTKLPEFRGEAKFSTWLYGIARFKCMNAIRKHGEALSEDGIVDVDDPHLSVFSQLRRHEREQLLRDAAAAVLDPTEQEAVHLRYVEGLPRERIDDLLGLDSASGTRGLLQRCRRKLQRELRRRLAELGHGSSFVRGTIT